MENRASCARPARPQTESAQSKGEILVLGSPTGELTIPPVDALEIGAREAQAEPPAAVMRDEVRQVRAPRPLAVGGDEPAPALHAAPALGPAPPRVLEEARRRPAVDGKTTGEDPFGELLAEPDTPETHEPPGDCALA